MFKLLASSHFQSNLEHYIVLSYIVLTIGVILEGEFFIIFSGIFTHLDIFNIQTVLPVIIFASVIKTFVWYKIGLYIDTKVKSKFINYIEKKVLTFLPNFKNNPFWSIFISKFVYGINHFVLILSGMLKIPFKKYFTAEMYASLFWISAYFSLGYFFSYTAFSLTKNLRFSFLILIGFVVSVFILQKIFAVVVDLIGGYNDK